MGHQEQIADIISLFTPVSLKEINEASLMDRVDVKFIVSADRLPVIFSSIVRNFSVLEIEKTRIFPYESTYFDTDDFLFFNQHMTGKLERFKVRYRKYLTTGTTFLEVKKTTNKKRTVKWRINSDYRTDLHSDAEPSEFIIKHLPKLSLSLKPVIHSKFNRITLAGPNLNERITIDTDLTFSDLDGNEEKLPFISIIELKKERSGFKSDFPGLLRNFSVYPGSFSKYCYGTALLNDLPRKNLLKSKILLINKLKNDYYRSVSA
jgi:hypothetical protein